MLTIRPATVEDATLLRTLIRELADYEHGLEHVSITDADIVRDGFGKSPKFRAAIAEWNGDPAGYALFFEVYSTWRGRAALFLEDLFVRPQFRGKGIGRGLLAYVAAVATKQNCYGVKWEVLDWNQLAIDFYKSIGADFRNEWRSMLLTGESLRGFAHDGISA
ncbi:MAG: GNAT family N-acetyltransferase [Terriglobales bacterium]|nr:GNAT family N-acetyltransferase [Terriglobales bacterium]